MPNKNIPEIYKDDLGKYSSIIENLKKGTSENLMRRQTYEWKMCITIWTPLVAFVGILLNKPLIYVPFLILLVILFLWVLIHLLWQRNLSCSNDVDIKKIGDYETLLKDLCDLKIDEHRKGFCVFNNWSHIIYCGITIALSCLILYVNNYERKYIIRLPPNITNKLELKSNTIEDRDKWIVDTLNNILK